MPNLFSLPHLLIILLVVVLIFGATKLPALAKGIGQSIRIFKNEVSSSKNENEASGSDSASHTPDTKA